MDRLGRSGCNIYHCFNYANAFHTDPDVGSGFCVNLECKAYTPWKEYAFVQGAYGYYFETQGNMFW
jgi:hypothetical protein